MDVDAVHTIVAVTMLLCKSLAEVHRAEHFPRLEMPYFRYTRHRGMRFNVAKNAKVFECTRRIRRQHDAGTDLSEDALAYARHHPQGSVLAAAAEQLPFADGCADLLVSSDVLEHLDDDRVALREYRRVLRPGGLLLVTVPSYQSLWSDHDERAGHRRRYRLSELTTTVGSARFRVERASYFFSYLVPPALAVRRTPLGRLTADTDEEASAGRIASAVLSRLGAVERALLRRRSIPFGLSQVVLASAVR